MEDHTENSTEGHNGRTYSPVVAYRMPTKLRDRFSELCKAKDLNPSQVARQLVAKWVEEAEAEAKKQGGLFADKWGTN